MAEQSEGSEAENTMSILVASDCHLGYMEKDQIRGNDSLVTFEEILQIAKERNVDFILLGGDLFHENKPSRKTRHDAMALFRKYCMGDKPCQVEFLSDQSVNFANSRFPVVNYEDRNYNISIPVFSIHGNHDDPAGDGNLCALDLLSVCGMVNYFGRAASIDDITVSPILIGKGTVKLALYGLGSIRDERLHRTFLSKKVKMLRPREDPDSWFNVFVLHQNRHKHSSTNYIPEKFLANFLDLVIWGHEHECIIDPMNSSDPTMFFYISQPGSSIATSLCEGESKPKHVGILEIRERKEFRMTMVKLKTVRPFYIEDVVLSDTALDPTQEDMVLAFLTDKVEELIDKAESEHSGHHRQPDKPLIRLRVDYVGGFSAFNVGRFGQRFVDRVANPKDILHFFRRKVQPSKSDKKEESGVRLTHYRPEALDAIRMEDLIKEYLTSKENALQLRILTEGRMAQALREFVEKDEKEAVSALVNWQLDQARQHLSERQNLREDNIEEEILKHTEEVRHREEENEDAEDVKKVLAESRTSQRNHDNEDGLSDEDERLVEPSTSRGHLVGRGDDEGQNEARGRVRGRGGRGRGRGRGRGASKAVANNTRLITDSFIATATFRKRKQPIETQALSSDEDENEFNNTLSSSVKKAKQPATSSQWPKASRNSNKKAVVSTFVQNSIDSDDSDDPFSMQPSSKKSRR